MIPHRVVVTGGAGFIGANLCRRLCAAGVTEVIALDDLSTGCESNLAGVDARLTMGSILDVPLLDDSLQGAASVVHLAARPSVSRSIEDPMASHLANATGTLMVLEGARRHGVHVVVASSSSVYGSNPAIPKSEDLRCIPISPYAVSKLASEAYTNAFSWCYDLPTLVLRLFNVYGPLQAAHHAYAAVVPAFVEAALAGRPLRVFGDGRQSRDFTYVGTVADALCKAVLRRSTSTDPVNLAFGSRTNLLELIQIIAQETGRDVDVEHVEARTGDVRDSRATDDRLREILPDLVPVPLSQGIAETVRWFREQAP